MISSSDPGDALGAQIVRKVLALGPSWDAEGASREDLLGHYVDAQVVRIAPRLLDVSGQRYYRLRDQDDQWFILRGWLQSVLHIAPRRYVGPTLESFRPWSLPGRPSLNLPEYLRELALDVRHLQAKELRAANALGINSTVPPKDVQALFGAACHAGKQALFFTSGRYSAKATEFGMDAGVELYIIDHIRGTLERIGA